MTTFIPERRRFLKAAGLAAAAASLPPVGGCDERRKPNIVILFSDDAGYADFGMHGSESIATPQIDALAAGGVRCGSGYVSAPVCSPSRAGLLTGRYQQRFGHEMNIGENYSKTDPDLIGLPVDEVTIADLLKRHGYATGLVGKWHLGLPDQFHPCRRGFDEFFGMLEGGSTYRPGKAKRIKRNFEAADYEELPYLTDAFGDEACHFIHRHRQEPFFLYLSFNAPHTPLHARPDYLEECRQQFETEERAVNAAMTRSLDENIGKVLATLKTLKLEDDTLIFFLNDNGGALPYNASSNDPLAGTKGTFLEGGIRVPFVARWPGVLPEGRVYSHPVNALDILPTAVAAASGDLPEDRIYDGVNVLPHLAGRVKEPPHDALFWRLLHHGAVRQGPWKLIWFNDKPPRLHRLDSDIGERVDLHDEHPEKVRELLNAFDAWQSELKDPLWLTHPKWTEHSRSRYDQGFVETLKRK